MVDDLPVFFSDCIKEFCSETGLAFSLSVLMKVLQRHIPATHISCSSLDLKTGKLVLLTALNELAVPLPRVSHGERWLDILPPHRMTLKSGDVVYLIQDAQGDPQFFEQFKKFDGVHRSILAVELFTEGDQQFYFGLRAVPPGMFHEQHAILLTYLRKLVAELLRELFIRDPAVTDGVLNITAEAVGFQQALAQCKGMSKVFRQVQEVASSQARVLILGETGVGKEMVAGAVHEVSKRRGRPFIKVNCGAIPESLLESELFGYERGAFTGAVAAHKGYFEQANGGTLYLDEIGELSAMAQVKLLRVLETRELQRIGSPKRIYSDFRLICATNKDLESMVAAGTFREDLWYRINTYPIEVPPLDQRREDIPVLARHFCVRGAMEAGLDYCPELSVEFLNDLVSRSWPGNVRQLQNWIERALLHTASWGTPHLLPPRDDKPGSSKIHAPLPFPSATLKPKTLEDANRRYIEWALEQCGGRIQGNGGAAEMLGLKPTTLRSRMVKMQIPFSRKRGG